MKIAVAVGSVLAVAWLTILSGVTLVANTPSDANEALEITPGHESTKLPFQYKVTDTPDRVVQVVQDLLEAGTKELERNSLYNFHNGTIHYYDLINHALKVKQIFQDLLPIAESFSGKKLVPTGIYGVREWTQGSFMDLHLDHKSKPYGFVVTHDKDFDWPFVYEKNATEYVGVETEPGQMIFYHARDYRHGRPTKFKGKRYVNFNCHFRPARDSEEHREAQEELSNLNKTRLAVYVDNRLGFI